MLKAACFLSLALLQGKQFEMSYLFILTPFDIWAVAVRCASIIPPTDGHGIKGVLGVCQNVVVKLLAAV